MSLNPTPKPPHSGTIDIYKRYWLAYGGWRALLGSVYFHISLVLTICLFPLWRTPGWWDVSISVLPSMIGFSLGGYAMLLSFGNERFQYLISKAKLENDISSFVELSATYTHFILIQILALIVALAGKAFEPDGDPAWYCEFFWMLGVFIFIYAIFCGVAATMRIFRLSDVFVKIAVKYPPEGFGKKPNADAQTEHPAKI